MWCWFGFRIFWTQPALHRAAFMPLTCFNVTTRGFTQHSIALINLALTFGEVRTKNHIELSALSCLILRPHPCEDCFIHLIACTLIRASTTLSYMAFCGVEGWAFNYKAPTAGYVTSCFSPSLGYPKAPKPHQNISWLSRVATRRLFYDPIALSVSWGRICTRHNPDGRE